MSVPPNEIKCKLCGKCVEVTVTSDPFDFNAPFIDSECEKQICPINNLNQPNSDQHVIIFFVECTDDSN